MRPVSDLKKSFEGEQKVKHAGVDVVKGEGLKRVADFIRRGLNQK